MSIDAVTERPRLSFFTKGSYAIGSIAYGLKTVAVGLILLFYNQVMGLPAAWVSAGAGIALIIDAVVDPIIGQTSDMWRSKWGRRHPFMYFSALPTAIAVFALLNPPHGLPKPELFAYMMACVIAARVFMSMFEIPCTSLLPEMTPSYDDRTSILSYRYLLGVLGPTIMGVTAGFVFFKPFINEHGQRMPGQLNQAGYSIYGIALAVVIFLAIIISALGTHSQVKYMRAPVKHASLGELLGTIGTALSNRSFLALTASALISGAAFGLTGGLRTYFSTYFWELSAQQIAILAGFAGVIGPLVGVAAAPFLSKRFGKKRTAITLFVLAIVLGVIPVGSRLLGILPPNGSPVIMILLGIDDTLIAALALTGFIINSSMMADVVEDVQVKSGRRSEGLLFAADTLLRGIVSGVGVIGTGFVLGYVKFPEHAVPGHVPHEVLTNMALIYLPITTIASLCSTLVISFYSITRASHESNIAKVGEQVAEAATTT